METHDCAKCGPNSRCIELSGQQAISLAVALLVNAGVVTTGIVLLILAIVGVIE